MTDKERTGRIWGWVGVGQSWVYRANWALWPVGLTSSSSTSSELGRGGLFGKLPMLWDQGAAAYPGRPGVPVAYAPGHCPIRVWVDVDDVGTAKVPDWRHLCRHSLQLVVAITQ